MNESIVKIIEKIKSIFGDSIFYEENKKQLISAVKDFAEDYEDEEFLVEAIENDDYEDGKSCLLKDEFYEEDNEIPLNAEEYNTVGNILYKLGVEFYKDEDYERAFKYFTESAKYENVEAQSQLAVCFYYGEGVEQNYSESVYWSKKAANKGSARAMRNLAICYMNGDGIAKDYTQSFCWCKKAALKEDADAQFLLAQHYVNGFGTEKNFVKMIYWAEKAATNQEKNAKNSLKIFYKNMERYNKSAVPKLPKNKTCYEMSIR